MCRRFILENLYCTTLLTDFNFVLKDNGTFYLIVRGWTADEEMLLLDAIEQHGLGNW